MPFQISSNAGFQPGFARLLEAGCACTYGGQRCGRRWTTFVRHGDPARNLCAPGAFVCNSCQPIAPVDPNPNWTRANGENKWVPRCPEIVPKCARVQNHHAVGVRLCAAGHHGNGEGPDNEVGALNALLDAMDPAARADFLSTQLPQANAAV